MEHKTLNKKKVFTINSVKFTKLVGLGVGSGLTISGPASVGIMCASIISFLSSISTFITIETFSKLKT